jgi:hypothetical protein
MTDIRPEDMRAVAKDLRLQAFDESAAAARWRAADLLDAIADESALRAIAARDASPAPAGDGDLRGVVEKLVRSVFDGGYRKPVFAAAVDRILALFAAREAAQFEAGRRAGIEAAAKVADDECADLSAAVQRAEHPTGAGKLGALCLDIGGKATAGALAMKIRALSAAPPRDAQGEG